jgi:hypothetical protein
MVIRTSHAGKRDEARADAFIERTKVPAEEPNAGVKTVVNLRFDPPLLARVDAAARRMGLTRSAWLHVAAAEKLGLDEVQR